VACTHNELVLHFIQAWSSISRHEIDEPRGHFAKWKKPEVVTNIVGSHVYVESKKSISRHS
jgi:hypothetical protein